MLDITIPGRGRFKIKHLILDLNGTINFNGEIIEGVAERLGKLGQTLDILVVTADTRGKAERLIPPSIKLHKIKEDEEGIQKLEVVRELGSKETISIGNGSNDVLMLKESLIGICILGREGASGDAIIVSDLIIADINDALDLLLDPDRLVATLRK